MRRTPQLIKAFILLVLVPLGIACTEVVDLELDRSDPRLVVEARVISDSVRQEVRLSRSGEYFSNQPPPPVSGAVVELEFNDSRMTFTENPDTSGLYQSDSSFSGEPGTNYRLFIYEVDINGDGSPEIYEAESTMPGGVELHYITLKYFPTPIISGYQVLVYASHTLFQRDFMGFRIYRNGKLLTETLDQYMLFNDDLFDDGFINGFPAGFLDDANEDQAVQSGDTVSLQLEVISRWYYDFVMSARLDIIGNNPLFSGPPANIPSNVSGGALGYFTAMNLLRTSVTVE